MNLLFLNPLLLAGLAALAIPIILHAFSQKKAPRVPFGAMAFLIKTQKRVQQRFRFHKLLLLLVRLLTVLLLVLLFARPQFVVALADPSLFKPAARAILIDNSLSMGWSDGESLIEKARTQAKGLIDAMGPEDSAAVIPTQSPNPGEALEFSRDRLLKKIKEITLAPLPTDFQEAFSIAGDLLGKAGQEVRQLVLLTDMTRPGFDPARTGFLSESRWREAGVELVLVDVAAGKRLPNLWIESVEASRHFGSKAPETRLDLKVAAPEGPVGGAGVDWLMGDERVLQATVPATEPPIEVPLSRIEPPAADPKATENRAQLRLTGDPLEGDNDHYFNLDTRRRLRILVLDGDWQLNPYACDSYQLDRALGALRGSGRLEFQTVPLTKAEPKLLESGWDAVWLLNPPALASGMQTALADWVTRGGGLMITMGDGVDPTQANSYLRLLLPHPLRWMRSWGAQSEATEAGATPRIQPGAGPHPFFFGYDETNITSAAFEKLMLLDEGLNPDSVLLRLDNGLPLLVEKPVGEGRVLVWLSTMDRDWTDFPLKTAYLPFVDQAGRYLAGDLQWPLPAALVGQSISASSLPRPSENFDTLELWSPEGKRIAGFPRDGLAEGKFVPDRAGHYQLRWLLGERIIKALDLPVNVDPAESDTRKADWDSLKPRLESAFTKVVPPQLAPDDASGETAGWMGQTVRNRQLEQRVLQAMLAAIALLLLAESFLLRKPTA